MAKIRPVGIGIVAATGAGLPSLSETMRLPPQRHKTVIERPHAVLEREADRKNESPLRVV
jgi:hypothetical protein